MIEGNFAPGKNILSLTLFVIGSYKFVVHCFTNLRSDVKNINDLRPEICKWIVVAKLKFYR